MFMHTLLVILCAHMAGATRVTRRNDSDVMPAGPTCTVGITDMMFLLRDGEKIEHRCDEFTCVNGTVKKNIFPCNTPINYFEDNICHKWSPDKCCCEEVGCKDVHGVLQPKDSVYQVSQPDPANPDCGQFCECTGWFSPCFFTPCGQPLAIQ